MNNERGRSGGSVFLTIALIVLAGGILFSGWKLFSIMREYHRSSSEFSSLSDQFVVRGTPENTGDTTPDVQISQVFTPVEAGDVEIPDQTQTDSSFLHVDLDCGFTVAFDQMWNTSKDVVAWISSEGTVIDYPVMRGADNDTYLHANWKGEYRVSGSIFVNARNTGDLSDLSTIIYGHNMKDGSMFHSVKSYTSQSYYESHPYLWYVTPEANYILYVVGGYVAKTSDDIYTEPYSVEHVRSLLRRAVALSGFTPDYVIDGLDADAIIESAEHMAVLSTCSYEFNDARYVLVAVPLLAN